MSNPKSSDRSCSLPDLLVDLHRRVTKAEEQIDEEAVRQAAQRALRDPWLKQPTVEVIEADEQDPSRQKLKAVSLCDERVACKTAKKVYRKAIFYTWLFKQVRDGKMGRRELREHYPAYKRLMECWAKTSHRSDTLVRWEKVIDALIAAFQVKFDDLGGIGLSFEDRVRDYCGKVAFGILGEPDEFSIEIARLNSEGFGHRLAALIGDEQDGPDDEVESHLVHPMFTGLTLPSRLPEVQKRRRGRPRQGDPKKDQKAWGAWESGGYKTHKECASAIGFGSAKEFTRALDRHRKRLKKM